MKDEVCGRYLDEIFCTFHEETCEPLGNPLIQAMRENTVIKSPRPILLIRRNVTELCIESTASPVRDDKGNVTGGVLVFQDVSEPRELNRRLSYHASHDILTCLVNRRNFPVRLERARTAAIAGETSYTLCYLDLDDLKSINNLCGHSGGDTLLQQFANLLEAKVRRRDTLARLGGDEFGVLLENSGIEQGMQTAEDLRTANSRS